jgi:arabinogalactan oligomer/maltooligosaccharide transport system substrate-binding protein
MKKIIALLLAVMMVVGLFAACGETKPNTTTKPAAPSTTKPAGNETTKAPETTAPKAEEITLKVWAPQEDQVDENSWLNVMLKKFEAAHPEYKITWELGVCSEGDALSKVTTDVSAAADVFMYANDQLGGMMQAEALAKLGGDYLAQVTKDNSETFVNTVTYTDGGVYGFPYTANTWFMYYDKSVFTEEDIKCLDTMLEKGTVAFQFASWYLMSMYAANGATLFGDMGVDAAAGIELGEGAVDVTNYLIDLAANPNMKDDVNGLGIAGLADGSVNAMFSGTWDAEAVKAALGDNMGAAQLPCITINGELKQMKSFGGSKAIGVNALSANPKAAMQLAAFLSSVEAQKAHYEMRGIIPAATVLATDPVVAADVVAVAQSMTMANTAIGQPTIPEMGNYWGPADTMADAIVNGEVTKDNAAEKTQLFEDSANGTGL